MKLTSWYPGTVKPVREGKYEAKQKSGLRFDVYWRTLQDTTKPSFYAWKGVLGPFNCWEDVSDKVHSWRGVAK
jgi:hypothetical protein